MESRGTACFFSLLELQAEMHFSLALGLVAAVVAVIASRVDAQPQTTGDILAAPLVPLFLHASLEEESRPRFVSFFHKECCRRSAMAPSVNTFCLLYPAVCRRMRKRAVPELFEELF